MAPHSNDNDGGLAVMDPDVIIREEEQLDDGGEHDRMSHFVHHELLLHALDTGEAVTAVCGKKWRPDPANSSKYPVCGTCQDYIDHTKGGSKWVPPAE